MCDPVVGMTLVGIGAVGSMGMQYAGMKQQQAATKSKLALDQKRTEIEVDNIKRRADRLRSTQRVAFTKAGVSLEGSPLEVMAQSAADAERDIANVRAGGAMTSRLTTAQGNASSLASLAGITSTAVSAGSTILSGALEQKRLEQG